MVHRFVFDDSYRPQTQERLLTQRRIVVGDDLNCTRFGLPHKRDTPAPDPNDFIWRIEFRVDFANETILSPGRIADLDHLATFDPARRRRIY